MAFSRSGLIAVSLAALLAAGCQSSRFSSDGHPARAAARPPVWNGDRRSLPPPGAPGSRSVAVPRRSRRHDRCRSTSSGSTCRAPPPPDITAGSVAGVWNATVSGQSCKVATPQTKFGAGFRAGPLRCPAPLDGVKSWNVAGKQLSLYDENGGVLARLYSSGARRFDGQTSTGLPISLSR